MRDNKLIRLFRSLSIVEVQQLKSFLESPFFNTNPSILAMYKQLEQAYPTFDAAVVKKKVLYEAIYPHKKYDKDKTDSSFRNLIMSFSNLLLEFMKQLELKQKPSIGNQLLMDSFSGRHLTRDFEDLYNKYLNKMKAEPPKDRHQFLDYYFVLDKLYHYTETDRHKIDAAFFTEKINLLNQFFVHSKLQLASVVASGQLLFREKEQPFFFKHFIPEYINSLPKQERPLLNIWLNFESYYHIFAGDNIKKQNLVKAADLVHQSVKLFKANHLRISPFDSKMILTVLVNQMNTLFQYGNTAFLKEINQLYIFGLKEDILIYNNSLSISDFLNIVTSATRNKETTRALTFIDNHKKYVREYDRELATELGTIIVRFELKQFDKIRNERLPARFKTPGLGVRFRLILVKTYVELVFQEKININKTKVKDPQIEIKSAQQFVRREITKKRTDQLIGFLNFLKVAKIIVKHRRKTPFRKPDDIRIQINQYPQLVAKKWLLQKVDDLEQLNFGLKI